MPDVGQPVGSSGPARDWKRVGTRVALTAAAAGVVIDRFAWAHVAQWREDQGVSMWLALQALERFPPVGLVSSVGLPNPNGIALAALPLTLLPGLLWISVVLGCGAAGAALLTCITATDRPSARLLLASVLCSSAVLRGISVELWGQWLTVPLNLLFLATVLAYLRRPRVWLWIPAATLILASPALYLAGLVNSVAFTLIWGGAVVATRRRTDRSPAGAAVALTIAAIGAAATALTWVPYFRAIPLSALHRAQAATGGNGAATALEAVASLPAGIRELIRSDLAPLYQGDPRIVPRGAFFLMSVSSVVLSLAAIVAAWTLVQHVRRRSSISSQALRTTIVSALFLAIAFPLSPLLGGFAWHAGQRLDQSVQLLPALLVLLFAPSASTSSRRLRTAAATLALLFSFVNLAAGWIAVRAHLDYRGPVLTEADVPLTHKLEAVTFIAKHWEQLGGGHAVPVAYHLTGRWHWLPALGAATSRWHPGAMTVGRALDYELRRRFGLFNAFEGQFPRDDRGAMYIVSYSFSRAPQVGANWEERTFGRLRVSFRR